MRVKTVPTPPEDPETVLEARRAVPLVPEPEIDCCARLADRLDLASRDAARTWLTFLRGMGLAERTERGFARTRTDGIVDDLPAALLGGVFGAREVRSIVEAADDALPADAVFERFEPHVPEWERNKHPGAWRDVWRDHVTDLLGWLVLLGLLREYGEGYLAP